MKKTSLLIAAIIILAVGAVAQEQAPRDRPLQEQKNTDISYARLSFLSGKIFLQRAADLGYEEASINLPISEGDRLGTMEGRVEVFLGKKNYVRLDNNSKIDFQTLPRKNSSLLQLRHWSGSLYLDLGTLNKEKNVEVMTANATFYVLEKGLYRIDVGEEGRTEILVFRGLVEASGAEGSILVKKEQRLSLTEGRFDGRPSTFFATAEDSFDRWNEDRSSIVNRSYARRNLPEDLEDYESELAANGDWIEMDSFGSVWVPRGMSSDWRPYSSGRWTWLPITGWCWVPYESWGWSTSHYGRWHWNTGYGWYWIPMSGWGPAWVNWWYDDYYYGWAPMSYWGYPGVLYNNVYYGRGWNRDYPFDSRALTVVRKNQLQSPDIGRAALRSDTLRSIGKINLSKTTLNVRPGRDQSLRIESLDGNRRVILKKDGESSSVGTVDPKVLKRDATKGESSDGRTIRPADRAKPAEEGKKVGTEGETKPAPRVIERSGKSQSDPPANPPPAARRIRKKDGSETMDISPFPSSSRITRESSGERGSSSSSLREKLYRNFQEDRGTSSSSSRSSSGTSPSRGSSVSPNRGSAPRSSAPSSSSRSGSSSSGSSRSSGGSIRKK